MKYFLRFHPELQEDIIRNFKWYQKKDPNIAKDFTELFYTSVQKININPLMYTKINEDYRRFLMKRFPYAIYYYIENENVIITGLFHVAQDPEIILSRLDKRKK